MLEKIRAKVIEANPEGFKPHPCVRYEDPKYGCEIEIRPVRLADVLLATSESNRVFDITALEIVRLWNLRTDDLEKQSEETLSFIGNVLEI